MQNTIVGRGNGRWGKNEKLLIASLLWTFCSCFFFKTMKIDFVNKKIKWYEAV